MTVLAIIPARGGSKGVPHKNLRDVGGRSLLARAIAACLGANGIDRVFVSTDDAEIQKAALAAGAEANPLRPVELANDVAPVFAVIQHVVNAIGSEESRITTIVLVEPTSPFRTSAHVAATVSRFRAGDCRSAVTVMPLDRKPENIFVKDRYLRRYITAPRESFARRQSMAHLCRINSAVYVVARDDVDAGIWLPDPIGFVEMDARSSINIDAPLDLEFAEYMARRYGI